MQTASVQLASLIYKIVPSLSLIKQLLVFARRLPCPGMKTHITKFMEQEPIKKKKENNTCTLSSLALVVPVHLPPTNQGDAVPESWPGPHLNHAVCCAFSDMESLLAVDNSSCPSVGLLASYCTCIMCRRIAPSHQPPRDQVAFSVPVRAHARVVTTDK